MKMRIVVVFEKIISDNSSIRNLEVDKIYYNIQKSLEEESDPNTLFLFVDSNYEYSDTFLLKILEKWRQNKECAVGSAGYKNSKLPGLYYSEYHNDPKKGNMIPHDGAIVDNFYFYPGVLVQKKFLENSLKSYKDINKYLSNHNVIKKVFRLPRVYKIVDNKYDNKKLLGVLILISLVGVIVYNSRK